MTEDIFNRFNQLVEISPVPIEGDLKTLLRQFYVAGAISAIEATARGAVDKRTLEICKRLSAGLGVSQ